MRSGFSVGKRLVIGAAAFAAVGPATTVRSGDLAPPAGPVSPTMKTLDEVEARINLNALPGDANSVHLITSPGSYYLTADIAGEAGKFGVLAIVGGLVTIDLNGFRLLGAPGSRSGIQSGGNTVVRDGEVQGWGEHGVEIGSGRVERVHAHFNGGAGIHGSWGVIVTDCLLEINDGPGIDFGDNCRASGCIAKGNGGAGLEIDGIGVVERCDFYNNECGVSALGLVIVESCVFNSNDGASNSCDGIRVGSHAVVRGNHVLGGVRGVSASGNGNRIEGNHVSFCGTGYDVEGVDNMVTGNIAVSCTVGYDIAPGNAAGAVVATPAGAGAWDNFER